MRWVFAGLFAAIVAAVIFFPLRLAVDRLAPGLEADSIEGSIWNGRLRNARWGDVPLGNIDVGLQPRSLLSGDPDLAFTRLDPQLQGIVGGNRSAQRIQALNGALRVTMLPPPVPAIDLAFADVSVAFATRGECLSAAGNVSAQIKGLPLIGDTPLLSGSPRCDQGAIHVPLTAGTGQAALDLWLWRDGRYRAGLRLMTGNQLTQIALISVGFKPVEGGVALAVEGRAGQMPTLMRG